MVGPPDLVAGPVFKTGGGHGDMSPGGSIPLSYRASSPPKKWRVSTPSGKKPEQAALLEAAASEQPEWETKSSARYASSRPFRKWQPEQGQSFNNRHPVPAHGRGLSQEEMEAGKKYWT